MSESPHISYTIIQNLLERYNITKYVFWDDSYNVAGNVDNPNYSIYHSKFLRMMQVYDKIVTEFMLHYEPEIFDCDDFARTLKVAGSIAGINSVMYATGKLYYNGEFLGYHAFNLLPYALDDIGDNIILLLVEPQIFPHGGITPLETGSNVGKLYNYEYVIDYVEV